MDPIPSHFTVRQAIDDWGGLTMVAVLLTRPYQKYRDLADLHGYSLSPRYGGEIRKVTYTISKPGECDIKNLKWDEAKCFIDSLVNQ